MNDPCEVDPITLTADTGCQWDRTVALWNQGLVGRFLLLVVVMVMVTLAVTAIRLGVEMWQEIRADRNRHQHPSAAAECSLCGDHHDGQHALCVSCRTEWDD
jgi:uncharacterized paraquat-inducible protein A